MVAGVGLASTWCTCMATVELLVWGRGAWGLKGEALPGWGCRAATVFNRSSFADHGVLWCLNPGSMGLEGFAINSEGDAFPNQVSSWVLHDRAHEWGV